MLVKEIIAVYSMNDKKSINRNATLLIHKTRGTHVYQWFPKS
jgi:hypothetical protein